MTAFLLKRLRFREQWLPVASSILGLFLVACIGFLDFWSGPDLILSIFYLVPIGLATWYGRRWSGVFMSMAAAAAWFVADTVAGPENAVSTIAYWNAALRLGKFLVVVFLLDLIQRLNERLESMVEDRTARLREETREHALAAQAAKENEILFRQIAENIREVFWVRDATDNRLLYISPAYEIIWGRTCKSLYESSESWSEVVHPADRDQISAAVVARELEGKSDQCYRIVRPDGGIRWIQDRGFPVRDETGRVIRIIGIAEDISARKQVEERNAVFAGLSHRLNAVSTPLGAARIILDVAAELFGWHSAYVHLRSATTNRFMPVLTMDTINGRLTEVCPTSLPRNPSAMMQLVMREGSRLINRAGDDPVSDQFVPFGDTTRRSSSLMFVPVHSREGVVGILSVQSYTAHAYARADLTLLQAMADHCGDTLQRITTAETLRESEELFRTLFESAPIGVALHRADGSIFEANRAFRSMLGYSGEELLSMELKQLLHPDDAAEAERWNQDLIDGWRPDQTRQQRFLTKDGRLLWTNWKNCVVRDVHGGLRFNIAMVEDISEQRASGERVRQLASIVDSAHDAIIGTGPDGRIMSWNSAAEQLYGYTQEEILGRPVSILASSESWDESAHVLEPAAHEVGIETVHQQKDGEQINVSLAISPILEEGRSRGVSVVARDVTERRRLEQEVLEIGGAERRAIGHDLHDGVGQHLAGTAFKAKLLQEILAAEFPQLAGQAGEVVRLINAGIDQVRRLAQGLDPIEVEEAGLEAALEQLADDTREVFNVSCVFCCEQPVASPGAVVGLQLYRIAQEAIHNGLEHGRARSVRIELAESDAGLRLEVADDGKGFLQETASRAGMGLRTMKYRARAVGGFLVIDSRVDDGTKVSCFIPALRTSDCGPDGTAASVHHRFSELRSQRPDTFLKCSAGDGGKPNGQSHQTDADSCG